MPSLALHQAKDALKPQSHPLSTLEKLKKWSPLDKKDTANRAQPLRARPIHPNHQQLVVCHDMAGGYKEDKDVQGNNYKKIYHFDYWQYVDTFIYFSHERVAIPPVQWINACHANGVRCLGTFLVEDERGADELLEFLHGPPDATIIKDPRQLWNPFYPDKLVDIAVHYGFDGWLINVESSFFDKMPPPVFMAQQLSKQVNYLREALHMQIPDSLVLWYDSMTTDGVINYQNTLNESNAMFFDASDGIYLNYWWKNTTPSEAVQEAKDRGRRAEEVYFGTDVWGRKTYGGGQFNSYKGVQDAMEAGASSVLFGTAWTYEYFSGNKDFDDTEFRRLERLFWLGGQNEEFPIVNVTSADDDKDEKKESHVNETVLDPAVFHPGVGAMIRPAPSSNWFATWFDRGLGDAFYFHGQRLLDHEWSHLSHQRILPSFPAQLDHSDAYIGGTSVLLRANTDTPLYRFAFEIPSSGQFTLSFVHKQVADPAQLQLTLQMSSSAGEDLVLSALGNGSTSETMNWQLRTTSEPPQHGWETTIIDFTLDKQRLISNNSAKWTIRKLGFTAITKNALDTMPAVRLGSVSITTTPPPSVPSSKSTFSQFEWQNVKLINDDGQQQFYGTLEWQLPAAAQGSLTQRDMTSPYDTIDFAMLFLEEPWTLLGTTFAPTYRISGLDLTPSDHCPLANVVVQAINMLGQVHSTYITPFPCL